MSAVFVCLFLSLQSFSPKRPFNLLLIVTGLRYCHIWLSFLCVVFVFVACQWYCELFLVIMAIFMCGVTQINCFTLKNNVSKSLRHLYDH